MREVGGWGEGAEESQAELMVESDHKKSPEQDRRSEKRSYLGCGRVECQVFVHMRFEREGLLTFGALVLDW